MGTDQSNSSERDRRLDEVVAGYLHALASNAAPSRDQVLASHPDLAAELASFFEDRDRFDRWAEPLRRAAADDGPHPQSPLVAPPPESKASAVTVPDGFRPRPGPGPAPPPAGRRTIGKFELLGVLGQGGFGTVYKALDTQLARIVALKVPRRDRPTAADELERFLRGGRSVARLRHPAIVPVYEV